MSSILKALRKLEEEKARQEQGKVDIATDILRSSGRQTSRNWTMPLLIVCLLIVGAACGVYLVRSLPSAPIQSAEPLAPKVVQEPAGKPAPHIAQPTPELVVPPAEIKPAQPAPAPVEVKEATSLSTTPVTATSPVKAAVKASVAETQPPSLPALVLSGIVYQEDPQSRMAVINDLPVMSGTVIEGAEVIEIMPDRVVFSYENQRFSIGLSDQ